MCVYSILPLYHYCNSCEHCKGLLRQIMRNCSICFLAVVLAMEDAEQHVVSCALDLYVSPSVLMSAEWYELIVMRTQMTA